MYKSAMMVRPRKRSGSPRRRVAAALQWLVAGLLAGAVAATTAGVNSNPSAMAQPSAPATIEPDGTLDTAFDAGVFTNGQVLCSALQSDGKLLIGGEFTKVHGQTQLGLARLNADGTLASSFVLPAATDFTTQRIVLQTDAKIILVSNLSNSFMMARVNSDGSLDNSFAVSVAGIYDGVGS